MRHFHTYGQGLRVERRLKRRERRTEERECRLEALRTKEINIHVSTAD